MTNSWTKRLNCDQERVTIAIRRDVLHNQSMPGRLALEPKLIARSTEKRHETTLNRLAKRLVVHEADHQDAMGLMVLNDCGNQSALLAEIEFHSSIPTKKPAWLSAGCHSFSEIDQNAADRPVIR